MTEDKFFKVVNNRLDNIVSTLRSKGKEYSTVDNKLHNFDVGSKILGQSRERVLNGFMLKHYISYLDIIDNIDKGILPSEELLNEKCTDLINYFILFEASVIDKINNKKNLEIVSQYDLEGKFIKTWSSITDVNKELNISLGNLSSCLNNKRKNARGYIWQKEVNG